MKLIKLLKEIKLIKNRLSAWIDYDADEDGKWISVGELHKLGFGYEGYIGEDNMVSFSSSSDEVMVKVFNFLKSKNIPYSEYLDDNGEEAFQINKAYFDIEEG